MTTTETMDELTRRGQDAFVSAIQIWADALRPYVGLLPAPDSKVPTAEEVVDKAYDFAAQALVTQREFTKKMLAAASSVPWAPHNATKDAAAKKS